MFGHVTQFVCLRHACIDDACFSYRYVTLLNTPKNVRSMRVYKTLLAPNENEHFSRCASADSSEAALAQRQSVSFVSLRSARSNRAGGWTFFANMFFSHHKRAGVLFLSMDVMTNIFTVYLCKTKTNAIETMSLG